MIGASRGSLLTVQELLSSRTNQGDLSTLSSDLLKVADLITSEKSLRQTLADSGQAAASRVALVTSILESRISGEALSLIGDVVSARWSTDGDLIEALEILGATAAFIAAKSAGTLDRIENEVFHFGRAVDGSEALQMTLTDPALPASAKSSLVSDLLTGKAESTSIAILTYFVAHLRGRRIVEVIESLSELAAAQNNQVVAQVRSAVNLDDQQVARLAAALTTITGRQVKVNVALDASVLGGISVKIGNEVIDGTVATRLEQARRSLQA